MKEAREIILYQPDEEVRLEVRLEHNSGELDKKTTCSILEHVGNEGKQKYATQYYNLDAILSVGYRVNSRNATLFRRWASNILKEYLLKGYAINQRLSELEQTVTEHSKKIDFFVRASLPPIEGVFYNGQIFDAYKLVADIIKSAKKSILLIDNYVDESVLLMLAKRGLNVSATIYTSKVSSQLQLDFDRHNAQ